MDGSRGNSRNKSLGLKYSFEAVEGDHRAGHGMVRIEALRILRVREFGQPLLELGRYKRIDATEIRFRKRVRRDARQEDVVLDCPGTTEQKAAS